MNNAEKLATALGWCSFVDDCEPDLLVVAGDDYPVHFTGSTAWEDAIAWTAINVIDNA